MATKKGSKTKLVAAIAAAVAPVAPVAPVTFAAGEQTDFSKAIASGEVLVLSDLLVAEMSPAQAEAIERFAVLCLEHDTAREAFTEQCQAIVKEVGQMPWDLWKKVIGAIRADIGQYPATCYRNAYKALYGALPSAGTGKGDGNKKGQSPKQFANGLMTRIEEVLAYIEKYKTVDVNAATLAKVASAADAMLNAGKSLKRAVNE